MHGNRSGGGGDPATGARMRIGLLAPPWASIPPAGYGGTEFVVDQLARGLTGAGHDVVLFATGDSTCPVTRRWLYERAQPDRLGDPSIEARHVLRAFEDLADCDIVHDHTTLGPLLSQSRLPGVPVVATNHARFSPEISALYAAAGSRVAVVAISRSQRAEAPEVPVAAVIHHGLDPARYPFGERNGGYALFLGRMSPDKGPDRAARVARRAGLPLLIAAKMWGPSERRYFDEQVAPLLGDGVRYVGEVGGRDKLALLAGASVLINPLRWNEPFGLVAIEALACGTPVVTHPRGAMPEIVEHGATGFLCQDEDAMVAALGRLGEIDRRRCRAAVERHFTTARMTRDHLLLYRRLLEEPPTPPSPTRQRSPSASVA
jgi:glycosyltransferase involved in cell wall biosynthesis